MQGRPDEPSPKPKRFNPFLARTRAMNSSGPSGLEATTIGFTLVGFIVAGAGAGWLLDKYLGTSYWLPILFLVGVFGGFREMLLVLKRVNEAQAAEKLRKANEKREREVTVTPTSDPTQGQIAARKRMFEIPPPPFEEAAQKVAQDAVAQNAVAGDAVAGDAVAGGAATSNEKIGVENVLEQMLAQGDLSEDDLKELGFDVELLANKDEKSDDSARAG